MAAFPHIGKCLQASVDLDFATRVCVRVLSLAAFPSKARTKDGRSARLSVREAAELCTQCKL